MMSTYRFLKLEIDQGIGRITLNRPEVYNAFNDGLSFELQGALKERLHGHPRFANGVGIHLRRD